MNIKFANTVATVVSALFPGGIGEFNKKGRITVLPHPAKEVVVFHPELPESLKNKLIAIKDHPDNRGKNAVHIMTAQNFVELDWDHLRHNEMALVDFFNKLDPSASVLFEDHSNLIVITMPNVKSKSDETLPLVLPCLRSMQGLALAYVVTGVSVFKIEPDSEQPRKIPTMSGKNPKVISSHSVERNFISRDDITNLIIDIETAKCVDDIINAVPDNGDGGPC
jgi:hypothetical protein